MLHIRTPWTFVYVKVLKLYSELAVHLEIISTQYYFLLDGKNWCLGENLCVWPLDHPSTKFRFALWQGGICNIIYFLFMICQRCAWNIRCVIAHKVFYNLEPWFYQGIEASLEEAMSTKSNRFVPQPTVSFTIHSCFDVHLLYTLNNIGNDSVINKSTSKTWKSELNWMSHLRNTVSNFWGTWLCILDVLLV